MVARVGHAVAVAEGLGNVNDAVLIQAEGNWIGKQWLRGEEFDRKPRGRAE